MLNNNSFINSALLGIAFIWGITFVIVQDAISTLEPFTFNFVRFTLASLLIFLYLLISQKGKFDSKIFVSQLKAGSFLGFLLFMGYALQTFSLLYTTSGKAGFLTGLSVAIVPIISYFVLKQTPTYQGVLGAILAVLGLFLLAFTDLSAVNIGDLLALFCAFAFGFHIVYTGKFSSQSAVLNLVLVQLITVAVLSGIFGFIYEPALELDNILHPEVISALLITSLFATALAFIAQTYFQKSVSASKVALIFATEPVFAAIADFFWNGHTLGMRAVIGCLLILMGMLFAEIPIMRYLPSLKPKNENANM
ncbi:MAG: hypothetical protein K0S51_1246 [Bacillales bacterium]|jgi:drug/metabolite transporter (DMT)-like permease|nr:hypothetical protein [Bacillales bacterium]